ncbi:MULTISPECIES: hypothetical protein [Arthrobacter]|uniref:Uncharacterized protein n=1 Tax=Arthrobacter terricola TaxID=2547396 RepID=A0A4R5K8X3_9MICC|nr:MULTISPECIES: hypothetical protein [Arthrobacter]MBT8163062.1 hypothetical protein [Arthrobacter sp. GN70]TDF88102.1 hypothetical protein E1809_24085 [Arthrobacter terricola]
MKFRLGDPVRVIASFSQYFDQVGTVADIKENQSARFHVAGIEDYPLWFEPHELILAEPPQEQP